MGDTEEERGDHRLRDPPWRVRGSGHIIGIPALKSDTRKISPLSWSEHQWELPEDYRKGRFPFLKEHTLGLLIPDHSVKAADGELLGFWSACRDHPSTPPSPHWAPAAAPLPLVWLSTQAEAAVCSEHVHTWRYLGSAQTPALPLTRLETAIAGEPLARTHRRG